MEQMLDPQFYVAQVEAARSWLAANALLLSVSTTGQMIIVVGALLGARSITPRAQVTLERVTQGRRYENADCGRIAAALAPLAVADCVARSSCGCQRADRVATGRGGASRRS